MKLSLDALKERAGAVASEELMGSITGGVANACHDGVGQAVRDGVNAQSKAEYDMYKEIGDRIANWWNGL